MPYAYISARRFEPATRATQRTWIVGTCVCASAPRRRFLRFASTAGRRRASRSLDPGRPAYLAFFPSSLGSPWPLLPLAGPSVRRLSSSLPPSVVFSPPLSLLALSLSGSHFVRGPRSDWIVSVSVACRMREKERIGHCSITEKVRQMFTDYNTPRVCAKFAARLGLDSGFDLST